MAAGGVGGFFSFADFGEGERGVEGCKITTVCDKKLAVLGGWVKGRNGGKTS